jgi:trk system potassium uptake protein TrkA
MRAIIVGCGRVGAGLAGQLDEEGHDVTILDISTESFRRLAPAFSGQALRGDGTDESVLARAGTDGADWFFAMTNGDNRNILAAQLASQTFGIANVLCKINDPVRAKAYATLGVNTINRTEMMIDSIGRFMGNDPVPGAADVNRAALPAGTEPEGSRAASATGVRPARVVGSQPVGVEPAAPTTAPTKPDLTGER